MTTDIQIFNNADFGNVRIIEEDGNFLFCGSDVAKALGYAKPNDAIARHCRATVKRSSPISGKMQDINFISEGDVYRLIVHSKLPSAEQFEKWVFDEVLPSIRKNGAYMTSVTIDKMIDSPEFGIQLLTALKEERDKRKALEEENEQQRQLIAEYQPIKQYVDTILSSNETLTVTQIAADYDISARKLNQILREEGIQHNVNGQWILYREHMEKGYTKSKTVSFVRYDGTPGTKLHTQWTQKGRLMIHELLTKHGIMAVMDRENAG